MNKDSKEQYHKNFDIYKKVKLFFGKIKESTTT
jgi:hypothetical protein